MAFIYAEKFFSYQRVRPDPVWLDALAIFQTTRTVFSRDGLTPQERRRKKSLGMLSIRPDMAALICLRAMRQHLWDKYNVRYDGYHNKFKEGFDEVKSSRLLGFMETVQTVFAKRDIELEMILPAHGKKLEKISHAIRDCGQFRPEPYEEGREEAYAMLCLALPQKRFSLLEGAELLQSS